MAVNGKSRRSYRGAPVSNTLGVTLSVAATNITLAVAVSGWSTDAEPFFVVVDPGTAKEEKICVKYSSSTTLTVVDPAVTSVWGASAAGRGADNTVDRQHEQGAVIYPVFTATEANNANELVSKFANAGSIVYQGSGTPGTFTELAVGTAAQVLKVNSGGTAPEWGAVVNANIDASAAIALSKLATGALPTAITVASANLVDGTIVLADLAASLQAYLCPVGTINAYAGATAPTGWLLCNGTSTSGYAALAALVGATTPDMRGLFPIGKTASSTGSTLLGTGGTNTIATTNLPSHDHANTAVLTSGTVSITDTGHGHAITDPGHGHTIADHTHTNQVTTVIPAASHAHNNVTDYVAAGTNGAPTSPTVASISTTSLSAASNTTGISTVSAATGITASVGTAITMTNASTGSGTAYFQPFIAVNYIIKHD